jgi:hypothetical protein
MRRGIKSRGLCAGRPRGAAAPVRDFCGSAPGRAESEDAAGGQGSSARLVFTAGLWGERAVVCRAVEGRAGAAVEQQFGLFPTWTQAHEFAQRLNDGMELSPLEARQIMTDATLRLTRLLEAGDSRRKRSGCCEDRGRANAALWRTMLANLKLAETVCRISPGLSLRHSCRCLELARQSLSDALRLMRLERFRPKDLAALEAAADKLAVALDESHRHASRFRRTSDRVEKVSQNAT